ncbi:unnamed protein product [Phyllotreta striolata]|uniref:Succinate dehydrogenase [ubiquinone] cytochrome b small subunit n=1 Tax=Phyllotreta striolata TaxID=444603 RepID=A0A9N9TR13_PHYSR|nr:unnamed protein product [Phyllotreta striolata]
MALALVLRKPLNIQATQKFFKTTLQLDSKRPFTQIVSTLRKDPVKVSREIKYVSKRPMSTDHGKLWTAERFLSAALIGVVPVALLASNPLLDDVMAASIVIHFHWGLEACVVDYVRPIIVGPVVPKLAMGLLYLISISTLGGLLYYNHKSIGMSNTIIIPKHNLPIILRRRVPEISLLSYSRGASRGISVHTNGRVSFGQKLQKRIA